MNPRDVAVPIEISNSIRRTADEFEKLLRKYVSEAERDGDVQDFILRNFVGTDVAGCA